ncbi:diguanylate cyclase [Kordiimonas sp.]|uniref:sensor domain-containing diguanylate cyclase n=1 Tax=Kordiimonas sp. TaxID=1970157 RepID=UPI003A8E92BA
MNIQTTLKASMGVGAVLLLTLYYGLEKGLDGLSYLFVIGIILSFAVAVMLVRDLFTYPEHARALTKPMIDPDNLPEAVLISDLNGHIKVINQAADRLLCPQGRADHIKALFSEWHSQLGESAQAEQVVDAVLSSPDIQFSELLTLSDGRVFERVTRPMVRHGERLWVLRDISHMQAADSDGEMHRTMVEADAARTVELAEQLYLAKSELEAKQAELTRLANTDSLTGLLNRRRFNALGETTVTNIQPDTEVWVLMLDIDHFKRINDTYGHAAGDAVIRDFAEIIGSTVNATVGKDSFIGRMGGEEFAATLPSVTGPEALALAETIRSATEAHQTVCGEETIHFTTSVGLGRWQRGETTIEPALDRADQALYRAKKAGRNQVLGFTYEAA